MLDVSIIVVSYNARDLLRACLGSVFREARDISFEVIVVDNASTDGSVEMLDASFPDVRRLRNTENRGFAAANNQGIEQAQGRYVLLLNADTEIRDNAIGRTVAIMDSRPDVGVLGCRLTFADGKVQKSAGSFPSLFEGFLHSTFLYLLLPKDAFIGRNSISRFSFDREREVDWVIGAYLLVRREVIERVGKLDEQFFVYSEEVDFCHRVRDAGFRVLFTPEASIVHHWAGMSVVTRRGVLWLHVSQILYFKKYQRGGERIMLIVLKYIGLVFRVLAYLLVGILTLNRGMLSKAWYVFYAFVRLLSTPIAYDDRANAVVVPWTSVW